MFLKGSIKTADIMGAKEDWEVTAMAPVKTLQTESIGQRVARIRKERGITQEELAHYLNVSQPIVSAYERGEMRLHGELIVKLAKLLKVSADELLGLKTGKDRSLPNSRRFIRRLRQLDRLPKRDQDALVRTIDAFLLKLQ